jgi:hypothetical protein
MLVRPVVLVRHSQEVTPVAGEAATAATNSPSPPKPRYNRASPSTLRDRVRQYARSALTRFELQTQKQRD